MSNARRRSPWARYQGRRCERPFIESSTCLGFASLLTLLALCTYQFTMRGIQPGCINVVTELISSGGGRRLEFGAEAQRFLEDTAFSRTEMGVQPRRFRTTVPFRPSESRVLRRHIAIARTESPSEANDAMAPIRQVLLLHGGDGLSYGTVVEQLDELQPFSVDVRIEL